MTVADVPAASAVSVQVSGVPAHVPPLVDSSCTPGGRVSTTVSAPVTSDGPWLVTVTV